MIALVVALAVATGTVAATATAEAEAWLPSECVGALDRPCAAEVSVEACELMRALGAAECAWRLWELEARSARRSAALCSGERMATLVPECPEIAGARQLARAPIELGVLEAIGLGAAAVGLGAILAVMIR